MQTHVSWVLLDEEFAYKIKKPVQFPFVDYSTLEKRKHFCKEEVRLNGRLSPEIYLDVLPITHTSGKYTINGDGEVVEYAVKMRRLPDKCRMDKLVKSGKVKSSDMIKLAEIIFKFHKEIEVVNNPKYNSLERMLDRANELVVGQNIIRKALGRKEQMEYILTKSCKFVKDNSSLFVKRQKEKKIRICHGDLHTKNIFLTDKPIVFDCIEFNKYYNYADVILDVAFMAMDLESLNKKDLSKAYIERYIELSNDSEILKLLNFYKCFLAEVRTKVAALQFEQTGEPALKDVIKLYSDLAESYAKLI